MEVSLTNLTDLSPRELRLEKTIRALLKWFGTDKYRGMLNSILEDGVRRRKGLSKGEDLAGPNKREFAPKGTILGYQCSNCFKECTYTVTDPLNQPPAYCTESCQKRKSDNMKTYKGGNWECPTPKKTRFTSHTVASKTLSALAFKDPGFRWNYIYGCKCGGYHLTRKEYHVVMEQN